MGDRQQVDVKSDFSSLLPVLPAHQTLVRLGMHVSTGWIPAVPDLPSAWDAQAFKAVIRNDPRHALISAVPGWQVERQGISSFKGGS
jgi:hypothetical protein